MSTLDHCTIVTEVAAYTECVTCGWISPWQYPDEDGDATKHAQEVAAHHERTNHANRSMT